ncbi:hypothetical protein AAFC00_006274 [Neodothiora populina]|uniref:Zn(2)-C6 fungal-type domain-containing protein n=1 Tax=Neodothiora populina TaxID=2781224 RepID=A0ABR3P522_9PEZI
MSAVTPNALGDSSSDPSASSSHSQLPRNEQKKRRQVTVACNECRKRKVKCDGLRPSCTPCHSRNLVCFYEADPDATPIVALKRKYDQLHQQLQDSEEVLDMLRSRPEHEAAAILQRIRSRDLASALATIRDGDILMPQRSYPLGHPAPRSRVPTATETVIDAQRPTSSSALQPMESDIPDPFTADGGTGNIHSDISRFGPKNHSILDRPDSSGDTRRLSQAVNGHFAREMGTGPWSPRSQQHTQSEVVLYDDRLRGVKASNWTSVIIEDTCFANIISSFLIWDHPPWRLFDEDMFIEDMVTGRTNYCSRLLVNAVLAYGCQNYAAVDPSKEALGSFFFVEADQLWRLEEGKESLACIAASGLLHGLHTCRGKDKVGLTYLVQGVRMAQDMGLFRKKTAAEIYDVNQPQLRHGRAVVAWGLYAYVVSHSMYMHRDSLIRTPPPVPIPGVYPMLESVPVPVFRDSWQLSETFDAACRLWVIVKDLLPLYYKEDEPIQAETNGLTEAVVLLHRRLQDWGDSLPQKVRMTEDALPHIVNLHMQYHCVIAELFRPFIGMTPQASPRVCAGFPDGPATISMQQLRSLVYQYISRYSTPPVSVTVLSSILCVAYAAIIRLNDQEWRFAFNLCIRFLGELVEYFPVSRFILQGIYHSAERTRTVMPPEARSVFDYYNGKINRIQAHEVESSYPVDLNLLQTDLEAARLSNLIRGTGEISLEGN